MGRYRNFSLRKKLIVTLVGCIILPLLVIGVILNGIFRKNIRKKEYQINQVIVNQVGEDLNHFFTRTEELKYYCFTENGIQKIIKEKGDVDDYGTAGNWMEQALRGDERYYSFSILNKDKEIEVQRGEALLKEDKEAVESALRMVEKGIWVGPHKEQRVTPEKNQKTILSYYCGINDYETVFNIMAVLAINIDEEKLAQSYSGYMNEKSNNSCIIDEKGRIVSSVDKMVLGNLLPQAELINETWNKQGDGYIPTRVGSEKVIVFYTKLPFCQWFLVNLVPADVFANSSSFGNVIMMLSIFLSLVFGITFTLIQRKYINQPIQRLLEQINEMKKGNFLYLHPIASGDEIGILNKEFDDMSHKLHDLIDEVYTTKIREQEAELKVLIAQINPHFLYNTLDSIHWVAIRNKDYAVGDQLEALSEIFRHVLSRGKDMVTIREELEFLQNYIMLIQARFGKRIKVHIYAQKELKEMEIPKLLIQPLVENAILHGLEPKTEGGQISIEIYKREETVKIIVEDDGVGTNESNIQEKLKHSSRLMDTFALSNIDERIKLRYGRHYGLQFESEKGKGCRVTLTIPYEEGNERDGNTFDDN